MISTTPHIVVMREVNTNDGTNLHEFWELRSCWWSEDTGDDPVLHCYVAPWNGTGYVGRDGLPPKSDRSADTSLWSEAPEEVREQLKQEIKQMANKVEEFD
jgi:hypothetical protein